MEKLKDPQIIWNPEDHFKIIKPQIKLKPHMKFELEILMGNTSPIILRCNNLII